jgi:hypothetical protein
MIESRTSLVHTAFLDDGETLGEGEALKTLSTELYIVKYLTIDRLLQGEALTRASTSPRR